MAKKFKRITSICAEEASRGASRAVPTASRGQYLLRCFFFSFRNVQAFGISGKKGMMARIGLFVPV